MLSSRDWFLFSLTFVVGLTTGIYLYFTIYVPTYQLNTSGLSQSEVASNEFSVIGRSYGGNIVGEYVHPSYRIAGDGTYIFLRGGVGVEGQEPETGVLPRLLFNDLKRIAESSDLDTLSEPGNKEECNTFFDASDYLYHITVDGVQYAIDTCTSNISYEHELVFVLEDIWMYIHDPDSYQERERPNRESGRGFFESLLRQYFVPNERERDDVEEPVACTMEAKLCPDGSAVGRTGPNCEFAPCPGE
ncbi:MAG: hypothetical protein WDZ68_00650 [Candidatus Paceibacterota bacterium]